MRLTNLGCGLCICSAIACSSSTTTVVNANGGASSVGGVASVGGSRATGGAASVGGTRASGGSSAAAASSAGGTAPALGGTTAGASASGGAGALTGGASTLGGASSTGGIKSTAGSAVIGGAASGGAVPTGGKSTAGGSAVIGGAASGGAVPTGGKSAAGGATGASGGAAPTGGKSATGGAPTGGATPTGGSLSTGGATSCPARFAGPTCSDLKFRWIGRFGTETSSTATQVSGDGKVVVGTSGLRVVRSVNAGALESLLTTTNALGCRPRGVTTNGSIIAATCGNDSASFDSYQYTASGAQLVAPPTSNGFSVSAISADGSTLLGLSTLDRPNHPWLLKAATSLMLTKLSTNNSFIGGLSGDGSVAAGGEGYPEATQAWRWGAASGTVALPTPTGFDRANAMDVSTNGLVIVGSAMLGTDTYAASWNGSTWSATAIGLGSILATNGDGSISVGLTSSTSGTAATLWNATGAHPIASMILGSDFTPGDSSLDSASDVSTDGKVVVGTGNHAGITEGWVVHL